MPLAKHKYCSIILYHCDTIITFNIRAILCKHFAVFDSVLKYVNNCCKIALILFYGIVEVRDLITRCMSICPAERPSLEELLLHPWIKDHHLLRSQSSSPVRQVTESSLFNSVVDLWLRWIIYMFRKILLPVYWSWQQERVIT